MPFADLNVLLENQPRRVLLLAQAVRRPGQEGQEVARDPRARARPCFFGRLCGHRPAPARQITGTLAIEVLENGLHAVPLDLAGVGLFSAKLDGRDAPIGRDPDGRLSLLVEGAGGIAWCSTWWRRWKPPPPSRCFSSACRRPPAAKLTLAVPGDVEIKSGAAVSSRHRGPGRRRDAVRASAPRRAMPRS